MSLRDFLKSPTGQRWMQRVQEADQQHAYSKKMLARLQGRPIIDHDPNDTRPSVFRGLLQKIWKRVFS